MTLFGKFLEVNSSIGKLRDLLGHLDEKEPIDFNKYGFLSNSFVVCTCLWQLYNFCPNHAAFIRSSIND